MSGTTPQQALNSNVGALIKEIESLGPDFAQVITDEQGSAAQVTAAANSASAAAGSATSAATSATNASGSASAASTSAGNASSSATSAGSSATAAANSATTASNQASAAASSASSASSSASSASSSASSAQAALNAMNSGVIAPTIGNTLHGTIIGAGTSQSNYASFTAPANGWVVAQAQANLSGPATAGIAFNLYIDGNNVSGDNTLLSQAHVGVLYVSAGTAVTVQFTGTNSTGTNSPALSMYVSAFFVPATL